MCQRSLLQRAAERWVATYAGLVASARARAGAVSKAVAIVVVAYGIATLAWQENVPHHWWGTGQGGPTLLVVLGVLAGVGSLFVTLNVGGLLERAEADGRLITPCREIAWLVESHTAIERGAVGVHVWQIAGPPWTQWLRRRATFRSRGSRQMPVLWTRGKGVLGQLWAAAGVSNRFVNLEALNLHAADERTFCALPAATRFNMTWPEFSAGRHYEGIWATKLYKGLGDAPKLWGVLSIDVEGTGHAPELDLVLRMRVDDLRRLLDMCEQLL